ncbi:50S ribosomal protein L2 [Candidatus Dojkabacteria bacterium]|uniref:50S ribosomal protein L2 n=1 Tax=Candidatus Dojkabacteria bacterium TaxID=2099670 RepID=A0A955RKU7_9BACT|nr:50S ribosomal protein L2 [Candidatus Dojkabacteria bacterium]
MIKKLKPTTPTRRHTVLISTRHLSNDKLPSHLVTSQKYSAGRSAGKISTRHKGGRVKRKYRVIDFKRDKYDVEGTIESLHYDPNRSAHIALVKYIDGDKRLILATKNMKEGQKVVSGDEAPIEEGNAMPLKRIPSGSFVHNVELTKGQGGVLGRSAGAAIQKQGENGGYVQLKMPSGEIRLVKENNYATIGEVGNVQHTNRKLGKAGRKRKMGVRPTVRGVAMSWKHPHAGGQGKSGRVGTGGPPKTPWGKRQGVKTRKNKSTNKYIIKRRTTRRRPKVKKYRTIV